MEREGDIRMHDEHRLKDRVEVSLDNRQIFLLFFASAVLVALVFGLGVVVGKRLIPAVQKSQPTDPLALLDQLGAKEDSADDLTFPEALGKKKAEPKAADKADDAPDKQTDDADDKPAQAEDKKPSPKQVEPPRQSTPLAPENDLPVIEPPKAHAKATPPQAPKVPAIAKVDKDVPQAPTKGQKSVGGKEKRALARKAKTPAKLKGTYTLQLSAFQDHAEAAQFMAKLRSSGLTPHMVPARIPGRGVWYRVRLGSYKTWDDALTAKDAFEKAKHGIAYVARN